MTKKIHGTQGLTASQINFELQRGAKFVVYQYCISIVILTFRRASDIYFVRSGENAQVKGLKYILITMLCGWWGIPWGPIWSVMSLVTNLRGGKDVTREVAASLSRPRPAAVPAAAPAALGTPPLVKA